MTEKLDNFEIGF